MRAILLVLLVVATRCSATVWNVSPGAVDGDGSEAAPFGTIAEANAIAESGDTISLAAGVYEATVPIVVDFELRQALVDLRDGVSLVGSGRGSSILRGPDGQSTFYGIYASGVGEETMVRDFTVEGELVQGLHLTGSSPTLTSIDVYTDVVGLSSVAFDARDSSFPSVSDCLFDGGHSSVFIEFDSGGSYVDCHMASRPNETLAIIDSTPTIRDCIIEGGGRDTIVLAAGSNPLMERCVIGRGERWTVRVIGYPADTVIDLGGNAWFSTDTAELRAEILDARDDPSLGGRIRLVPLWETVATKPLSWSELKSVFEP